MDKVYCDDCFYFKNVVTPNYFYVYCEAVENIVEKDTWRRILYKYKSKPNKINKNNNCGWYKKKEVNNPPKDPNRITPGPPLKNKYKGGRS